MICADLVTIEGVPTFSPAASQPADLGTCAAVVLVGTDAGALSMFQFPTKDDAAQAWFLGFSIVFTSFLLGKMVGMVVNFLDRH